MDEMNALMKPMPTTLSYNAFGQPIGLSDPLGNPTAFEYDPFGNLTATVVKGSSRWMSIVTGLSVQGSE
jgi:YD repeat-containing protein